VIDTVDPRCTDRGAALEVAVGAVEDEAFQSGDRCSAATHGPAQERRILRRKDEERVRRRIRSAGRCAARDGDHRVDAGIAARPLHGRERAHRVARHGDPSGIELRLTLGVEHRGREVFAQSFEIEAARRERPRVAVVSAEGECDRGVAGACEPAA